MSRMGGWENEWISGGQSFQDGRIIRMIGFSGWRDRWLSREEGVQDEQDGRMGE